MKLDSINQSSYTVPAITGGCVSEWKDPNGTRWQGTFSNGVRGMNIQDNVTVQNGVATSQLLGKSINISPA
jgi:hypothetical protein